MSEEGMVVDEKEVATWGNFLGSQVCSNGHVIAFSSLATLQYLS